jgi:CheY-like chemotaxis protein
MALQSILMSSDQRVLSTLPSALKDAGVSVDIYTRAVDAFPQLPGQKVDAFIVDMDEAAGSDLIRYAKSDPRRPSVTVALASNREASRQALALGATLVLPKPLSREHILSGVRVTRSFAVQERRRTMRFPIQIPLTLAGNNGGVYRGIAVNVNQGGLGFKMQVLPRKSQSVDATFRLPNGSKEVFARARVVWADNEGMRGGLQFLEVLPESELSNWILDRCEKANAADHLNAALVNYRA